MGRPHKGEATLWGGPLGANKALTSTDTERKAQRKGLGRETPASGASPPGNWRRWPADSLSWGLHCRTFNHIPDLYPLGASGTSNPVWQSKIKEVSQHGQTFPDGKYTYLDGDVPATGAWLAGSLGRSRERGGHRPNRRGNRRVPQASSCQPQQGRQTGPNVTPRGGPSEGCPAGCWLGEECLREETKNSRPGDWQRAPLLPCSLLSS